MKSSRNPSHKHSMKNKKNPVTLGLAALAALCCTPAMAQTTGWYGGASVGRSAVSVDDGRIRAGLAAQGLGTSAFAPDDEDVGYKLFGGYQLNRNFAVEAGFFDLGHFGYTATTSPGGTLAGDISVRGLNLDLVGTLPLTDKLSALGRLGVTSARTEGTFSASGAARVPYANPSPSRRDTNAKFGLGLAYQFTESLAMRVEAERYRINDAVGNKGHADMVSVGLVYTFGGPAPAPRAAAPAPVLVVRAPPMAAPPPAAAPVAQAPVAAPMPPPSVPRAEAPAKRVRLAADSLFEFDRSTVMAAGRPALDKLADELRSVAYDRILVSGHTDRLGTGKYNFALSERRAAAVRDYLVQAGLPPAKFATSGQGEASPVTVAANCKGTVQTPALVACLQPDRRVEVEVYGTR